MFTTMDCRTEVWIAGDDAERDTPFNYRKQKRHQG